MLEARGIAYEPLHHREAFTSQRVAQQEHFSGHRVAKVVVIFVGDRPMELVLPAARHVDLNRIKKFLGTSEVRLASEEEIGRFFTDCEVGAVPPLRHWKGIEVLMDRSLNIEGDILFQAGTHEDAVRLNFRDWYEMVQPRVGSFTAPNEPVMA